MPNPHAPIGTRAMPLPHTDADLSVRDALLQSFAYAPFSSHQARSAFRTLGLNHTESDVARLVDAGLVKLVSVNVAHCFSTYRVLA